MINYETLLSSYDDKLTLMQWLKKVEAALKDASAVSFNVNKRGDATLTFSVVFEDGSELETAPIVLQQGESVTAAHMVAGHLILTLSNGDELDAGNLGAVSGMFINSSQHLIVTYQDGTTQDLGAIFTGNVVINGNFEVTGRAKLPTIEGGTNNRVTIDDDVIINDSDLTLTDGALSTSVITSSGDHIEAQKPVVEVMNGYTFANASEDPTITLEHIYAGAVKNGNKLTLVWFVKISKTSAHTAGYAWLGNFTIPQDVADKIYVYTLGGNTRLISNGTINFFYDQTQRITKPYILEKYAGRILSLRIYDTEAADFVAERDYIGRLEVTFLLSENLAA